jgi:hypothetical protein
VCDCNGNDNDSDYNNINKTTQPHHCMLGRWLNGQRRQFKARIAILFSILRFLMFSLCNFRSHEWPTPQVGGCVGRI